MQPSTVARVPDALGVVDTCSGRPGPRPRPPPEPHQQLCCEEVYGSVTEVPVELFADLATRVHATGGRAEVNRWKP